MERDEKRPFGQLYHRQKGYDGLQVVNQIILAGRAHQKVYTHLELQKLLYLCHGEMLAKHNEALTKDNFVAWQYGPVLIPVYQALKKFKNKPITERQNYFDTNICDTVNDAIPNSHMEAISTIANVVNLCKDLSAGGLVDITHLPDSPWDRTYLDGTGSGGVINNRMIRDYFQEE